MDDQEKDFQKIRKQKMILNQQKKETIERAKITKSSKYKSKSIRKKKEMKQITEKANQLKELESLKEMKKLQKEQLAKKYDEMIENAKPKEEKE